MLTLATFLSVGEVLNPFMAILYLRAELDDKIHEKIFEETVEISLNDVDKYEFKISINLYIKNKEILSNRHEEISF
jgi:hypothetical protein